MNFGYAQPFSFKIVRPEAKSAEPAPTATTKPVVAAIRDGVTEITLSDGRVVRVTNACEIHRTKPRKPGIVDVSYDVITEVVQVPGPLTMDAHETLQ